MSKIKQMRNVKPAHQHSEIEENYPNPGEVKNIKVPEVHENNYFKNNDADDLRRRYLRFSVFMEELNNTLDLSRNASVEQFAQRVHDLVMATQKI